MIGMSLPTGYLAGTYRSDEDRLWLAMYGEASACLQHLLDRGVQRIELRDVRSISQPTVVEGALDRTFQSGLMPTVHLWLPESQEPHPDGDELPTMMQVINGTMRRYGLPIAAAPSAIHGHDRSMFGTVQEAIDATIRDAIALARACAAHGTAFTPSLELCRLKQGGPVGTSFTELCQIMDRVDEATTDDDAIRIGTCWDLGHGLPNSRKHSMPLDPPHDFLRRTTHTHIHDLDRHGRTHAPLLDEASPIADMIRCLRDSGYDRTYNLELEPTRWNASARESRWAVDSSVSTLATILG